MCPNPLKMAKWAFLSSKLSNFRFFWCRQLTRRVPKRISKVFCSPSKKLKNQLLADFFTKSALKNQKIVFFSKSGNMWVSKFFTNFVRHDTTDKTTNLVLGQNFVAKVGQNPSPWGMGGGGISPQESKILFWSFFYFIRPVFFSLS